MTRRALLLALACAGCGGTPDRLAVYPVTGALTFDKRPAEGAMVVFHPLAGDAAGTSLRPSAVVQADGGFAPTTYDHRDGLPAGEYALTVFWPRPPGKGGGEGGDGGESRLPAKYARPDTSGLKVTVEKRPNVLEPIALTR